MSGELKRFFNDAAAEAVPGGYRVCLDGRAIRTPAGTPFCVPTAALAARVAGELAAQGEKIRPETMPMTRLSNAAIDRVAPDPAPHIEAAARVGRTDLLCYWAEGPETLRARQNARWRPLLDWAERELGARLATTAGIVAVEQERAELERLKAALEADAGDPFTLTGLLAFVPLTGSVVIALALRRGQLDPQEAWAAASLEEAWQRERWGADAEAMARDRQLFRELQEAHAFLQAAAGVTSKFTRG